MCHRITPVLLSEAEYMLESRSSTGKARMDPNTRDEKVEDVYPGKPLSVIIPDQEGTLFATQLTWGFESPKHVKSKLVFNTRLDTALYHANAGSGLWASSILNGRCLVPVRTFFETWTRNPPCKGAQVRFTYQRRPAFLLAAIQQNGRVSIVTTSPNGSVSPMHSRMPIVLGPGESSIWLGPEFAGLSDRSHIDLDVEQA